MEGITVARLASCRADSCTLHFGRVHICFAEPERDGKSKPFHISTSLAPGLSAGIVEEVFFRGFIMNQLKWSGLIQVVVCPGLPDGPSTRASGQFQPRFAVATALRRPLGDGDCDGSDGAAAGSFGGYCLRRGLTSGGGVVWGTAGFAGSALRGGCGGGDAGGAVAGMVYGLGPFPPFALYPNPQMMGYIQKYPPGTFVAGRPGRHDGGRHAYPDFMIAGGAVPVRQW